MSAKTRKTSKKASRKPTRSSSDQTRAYSGVTKDPLDLRDLPYEGSLLELPFELDNRNKVPMILDQGQEGACTGFGLAAVVNFLFHNRTHQPQPVEESVSARMLYEMAKRYDEWEGENYDGSSIRGAMKGWHKHGVCREDLWRYQADEAGRLTPEAQLEALNRPMGNYFRVSRRSLNHIHSAIREAGIVYASAAVHEGWNEVDTETGRIPFRTEKIGGHAFAIVGYDKHGFWVQNSWSPRWGLTGCCHITYDDWLENGMDCWVARLGVPTTSVALKGEGVRSRVSFFDYIPHQDVVLEKIRPHFVNLGNDGVLSEAGRYNSDADEVRRVVQTNFEAKAAAWGKTPRLMLYAHGGLNTETASASRIASLLPIFLANEIYPLHFMWETGLWDSIRGIVQDSMRHRRMKGWQDNMRARFFDLLDEAIELGSRGLGRPIWSQMKDNACCASEEPNGGALFVANKIAEYASQAKVELHLVGHSAGSIFHAHLLPLLVERGLAVKTLTLFAPACTMALFESNILPHVGKGIERLTIFNLNDETERDDSVTSIYHKSLLYLVSEAFEAKRGEPLLGMQKCWKNTKARRSLGKAVAENNATVIHSKGGPNLTLRSNSTTHGGFDNDEDTLNSTLRIILGRRNLRKKFEHSPQERK